MDCLPQVSALGLTGRHFSATLPQYLVVFPLDTTGRSRHNPRHHVACARIFAQRTSGPFSQAVLVTKGELRVFWSRPRNGRASNEFELCGFWGRENAIFARLHGAVYQSAMRSPRSLASRRCHHSSRQRRPLPLLRRLPAQRSPAAQPALPYAPPLPHGPPAPPSPPALRASDYILRTPLASRELFSQPRTCSHSTGPADPLACKGNLRPLVRENCGSRPGLSR